MTWSSIRGNGMMVKLFFIFFESIGFFFYNIEPRLLKNWFTAAQVNPCLSVLCKVEYRNDIGSFDFQIINWCPYPAVLAVIC
jgi:hypothetical protein